MIAKFLSVLDGLPPDTHLYQCSDGRHLAVMVVNPATFEAAHAAPPLLLSHVRPEVGVFHADENGTLLDADGEPLNGLTPYASTDDETDAVVRLPITVTTHAEALAALGYTLTEQETS